MKLQLENGIYEGEGYGNIRHGYGVMRFNNGTRYEGQFVNDRIQGRGKYYFANGDYYEGELYDDIYEGHGEYHHKDGLYYFGEFKNDKLNGHGKVVWPNGDWHEGEYIDNMQEGKGQANFGGYIYVGEWNRGKFSGKGTITCPDGTTFDGVWGNGYGTSVTATFAGGVVKQGRVIYRKFVPIGVVTQKTVTYSNGTYVGDIVEGKRHGLGKYTFTNGVVYDGDWVDGYRCGEGKLTASGFTYEGDFLADHRYGGGEVVLKDGTRTRGSWIDDETAYDVTQVTKDGKERYGIIIGGKFIPDTTPGYATKLYDNGVYMGIMKNGTRVGEGIYLWKNGNIFAGLWCRERFGKGVFTYADGALIKGTWIGSRFAYDVTQISEKGVKRTGLYIQDKFVPDTTQGFETVKLAGGEGQYIGVRKNGKLTGYACVKYSNGDIAIGVFDDGHLVDHGATGLGQDFYVGQFVMGKAQGKGVYYFPTGEAYEGEWRGYDYADNVKFLNAGKTTVGTIRGGLYTGK